MSIFRRIENLIYRTSGDKVLFFQKQDEEITKNNASLQALHEAQAAFVGVAEVMGIYSEEDIRALVDEVRYGKKDKVGTYMR